MYFCHNTLIYPQCHLIYSSRPGHSENFSFFNINLSGSTDCRKPMCLFGYMKGTFFLSKTTLNMLIFFNVFFCFVPNHKNQDTPNKTNLAIWVVYRKKGLSPFVQTNDLIS